MKKMHKVAATTAALTMLFATAAQAQAAAVDEAANIATTQIQKISGSDDLFLVEGTTATYLTFDAWVKTGLREPVTVAAIPGTKYLKQGVLDPIFANVAGRTHHLSFDEWIAAGAPKPELVAYKTVKLSGLAPVFSVTAINGDREQWLWNWLTHEEWAATQFLQPQITTWVAGVEYARKRSAPSDIYAGLDGDWVHLTFEQWVAAGAPQPKWEVFLDVII